MQNSNQPNQQTDKNKGDQSAVEQQKKETMKNPSPENMGGAQNAQQQGQSGQSTQSNQTDHKSNQSGQPDQADRQSNQSDPTNRTNQAGQSGQSDQADRQVTGKNQQTNNNDGAAMNPANTGNDSMTAQDHDRMEEKSKGMTGQGTDKSQQMGSDKNQQGNTGSSQGQKGGMGSAGQGQSKNQGK